MTTSTSVATKTSPSDAPRVTQHGARVLMPLPAVGFEASETGVPQSSDGLVV